MGFFSRRLPSLEEPFQFILVQAPDNAKNKIMKRLAQSHAVKQALKKKRILQQKSQDNFRGRTSSDMIRNLVSKRGSFGTLSASLVSPSAGALDPFQALAIDSSRLQTLLGDRRILPISGNLTTGLQMVQTRLGRLLSQFSVLPKSLHFRIFDRFSELV